MCNHARRSSANNRFAFGKGGITMNNDVITINDDVTYPCVTFMQIDTKQTVKVYDVTDIIFDDTTHRVYIKGKTDPNGANKKIEMYNTRIMIKEEDDL